jgi:DNA (cytosine-5)-methyltransferase 1
MIGLAPGELDVFDGSPPCQGFSTAGKRNLDDPRNQLFREYVRLLRGLMPRVFVMENVSGMVKGKMKLVFAEILRELKACGYRVSARLLNAMYFNVPQSRQRMIFIGVRDDLGIEPSHPIAQTRPTVVRDAFAGLMDDLTKRVIISSDSKTSQQMQRVLPGERCRLHHSHHRLSGDAPSPTVDRGGGAGAYHIWHPSEHRPITTDEAKRLCAFPDAFILDGTVHEAFDVLGNAVPPLMMKAVGDHLIRNLLPPVPSALKVKRWNETPPGGNHHERFSLSRLDMDRTASTIQKTVTGSSGTMHPTEPRELTELELKRLCAFPDLFQMAGKWSDVVARLGNSVPPLFMRAIARHIETAILGKTPIATDNPHAVF